jgi:primosomal protein N''
MKRFKSFSEHQRSPAQVDPLEESFFSKGYAISQNAQHNSASQKIASLTSKVASLARDAKQHDEFEIKINKLCDAVIAMTEIIKTQSQQSTSIKNVVVASALTRPNQK